jgi:hypothetical protein
MPLASVAVVIVTVRVQRKANELARLGDSFGPVNRRPASLPATSSYFTGEQPAVLSRQLGLPRGRGNVRGCSGRARRPKQTK